MAINRFSTIQGLPEWQPQIPLDILVKGLTYKQELFDKNKALLETNVSLGKSVADLILNDEAKKYTQDKINSYKNYLNTNLAYADLTDDAVMKSADTKLGDVTNDMDIVNWVSKSKNTTKEMNRIDELKKKGDARYDQLHENSFMLDVNALKTSSMKDGLNLATPSYTDFYDADKEKQELIKNFKPNHIKYSKILPGGRMMDIEDQSVYQEQLQAYLEANLSDKAKRELAFRGEYEYKAGYQYEKDDTRKQNFANNISNRYLGIVDGQIKAIDTQIEIMKQQQLKLDPKDKNYDAELSEIKNNINLYERQKQNHVNDKELFLKDPTKYTKDISQRLYISSYVANAAKGNTRIDKSETLKSDEAYWSGLNYNLERDKFNYTKQKDALNLELEYFKAGVTKDKNGRLTQVNVFGTPTESDVPGFQFGGYPPVDPSKSAGSEFVRGVEQAAVGAKEQIYNEYYRKWEQEAAGSNGFFTPEQKAEWNKKDAAWKKDYFQQKVLPQYYQYLENSKTSITLPNGQKVTRDASYVPQWFKDMKADPKFRNSYMALGLATQVQNRISKNFEGYEGKFKSPDGRNLSAMDLSDMALLQKEIEESININDAYSLQNLLTNINNYISSRGKNTGEGWADFVRTIAPGYNYSIEEINELSRKFGGIDKLKRVTENLLHNTNQGNDLVAFGGRALQSAAEWTPGGAVTGGAIGLAGGPFAPITVPVGTGVGAAVTATAGFIKGLGEEILGRSTSTGFEGLADEKLEAISQIVEGMTINTPVFRATNKEGDFYKKAQNPQAIELANDALREARINQFVLNSNEFQFESVDPITGDMTFSYIKGSLTDKQMEGVQQGLTRVASSSGGISTYDGEANTLKVKVNPKNLGLFAQMQEFHTTNILFDNGLIESLPKTDYYARNPKTGSVKAYTFNFGMKNGQTELSFYRDGKKITIPRITKAEAKAAGIMETASFLDLKPVLGDAAFKSTLQTVDANAPGRTYNDLDQLLNYAENYQ